MDAIGGLKTWALIVMTTLFLGGTVASYFYYKHTQAQIVQLEINNAALKAENDVLAQANIDVQVALNGVIESITDVAASRDYNRRRIEAQDIGKTAVKDAATAQKIINENQKLRSRCLEIASGSPIMPSDITNTVCPKLVGEIQ